MFFIRETQGQFYVLIYKSTLEIWNAQGISGVKFFKWDSKTRDKCKRIWVFVKPDLFLKEISRKTYQSALL